MNRQSTLLHHRLEAVADLSALSPVSDDIIVSCLRERFLTDNIYTHIGTSALVAVNPHKYVASNADSVLYKYSAEHRSTADDRERLPPHIFQLADNAYYHMRRTTQDQCIILKCVDLRFRLMCPDVGRARLCRHTWHDLPRALTCRACHPDETHGAGRLALPRSKAPP